jgi:cytochrome c peroxidase
MKKTTFFGVAFAGFVMLFTQCKLENSVQNLAGKPTLPEQVANYASFKAPAGQNGGFGNPTDPIFGGGFGMNSANPQITDNGATLGRVLFYDTKLSLNNAVACASCHKQDLAFADEASGSVGFGGKITPRNSMAIVNAGFNNNLFWDSRAASVKDLVSLPIQNHIEMGMESMDQLTRKLKQVDYYGDLFKKAYGTNEVSGDRIASALAQFVGSMVSSDSKWDQGMANDHANYTPMEKVGKDLFFSVKAKCSQCHAGANFAAPDEPGGDYGDPTIRGTANIGLNVVYTDNGKGQGQFRIPSLRNIAMTGPYMHDGRFKTLAEVVEHYNSGVQQHPNLDTKLMQNTGAAQKLGLTPHEKESLIAFLGTLTDQTLTHDTKFSSPFSK